MGLLGFFIIFFYFFNFTIEIKTSGRKFRISSTCFNPPSFVSFPPVVTMFCDPENETIRIGDSKMDHIGSNYYSLKYFSRSSFSSDQQPK